jgi:hypothetical protein
LKSLKRCLNAGRTALDRFGQLLRFYRQRCTDPERGGKLTQERLGELIGAALGGAGYTGAAVSDWERDNSKIDKDYRFVLVNLIKIFYSNGGLQTLTEANTFLEAGNYRSLDESEIGQVFPKGIPLVAAPSGASWLTMFFDQVGLLPGRVLYRINDFPPGFPPRWGGRLLAWLAGILNRQFFDHLWRLLVWLCFVCLTLLFTFPMMNWPFEGKEQVFQAVICYAGASMLLPLGIGAFSDTRKDEFWQAQNLTHNKNLRFYTHLGATVGYQVGYFMLFVVALLAHFLGMALASAWPRFILSAWPVILGAAAAQQIPFTQWRAYGRLRFSDGAIFLVFYLFGPAWAIYFYLFYSWLVNPLTGIPIVIVVAIFIAILSARQNQLK